jgi:hypothetical protein
MPKLSVNKTRSDKTLFPQGLAQVDAGKYTYNAAGLEREATSLWNWRIEKNLSFQNVYLITKGNLKRILR